MILQAFFLPANVIFWAMFEMVTLELFKKKCVDFIQNDPINIEQMKHIVPVRCY